MRLRGGCCSSSAPPKPDCPELRFPNEHPAVRRVFLDALARSIFSSRESYRRQTRELQLAVTLIVSEEHSFRIIQLRWVLAQKILYLLCFDVTREC